MRRPTHVVKLGGSVLRSEADLVEAVHELHRRWRAGQRVLVIASARFGETDRLQAEARGFLDAGAASVAGDPAGTEAESRPAGTEAEFSPDDPTRHALAALLATGEAEACARLALALARAGIDAEVLDAGAVDLQAEGPVLDATPHSLDRAAVERALERTGLVLLSGFVARDRRGRTVLLGRGGSDLTALFCADALDADGCTLLKDVPGLFEWDPARPGPGGARARRYAHASFDRAEALAGEVLQPKAVAFARAAGRPFEVAALGGAPGTRVGLGPDRLVATETGRAPLRVALLGLGTVNGGLLAHLLARPDRYEVVGALVRDPHRARPGVPNALPRTADAGALARWDADVWVEALGGETPARDLVRGALAAGRSVVTANKALLAAHGPELERLAARHGARLLGGAAVGGVVPCLETVAREAARGPLRLEAVLNGTTTHVLERLAAGDDLDGALASARARGLCERDADLDLEGHDAAHKLRLLVRAGEAASGGAFGGASEGEPPVCRTPFGVGAPARPGAVRRQVARAVPREGRWGLSVDLEELAPGDPLARTTGAGCALRWRAADGSGGVVNGAGAGRWPTAQALLADVDELRLARDRSTVDGGGVDGGGVDGGGVDGGGDVPRAASAPRPVAAEVPG